MKLGSGNLGSGERGRGVEVGRLGFGCWARGD